MLEEKEAIFNEKSDIVRNFEENNKKFNEEKDKTVPRKQPIYRGNSKENDDLIKENKEIMKKFEDLLLEKDAII